MEGVAFSMRDVFELIRESEAGRGINQVRVSGGGAQSPLWRQILADVLNVPLVSVEAAEGAAYGAALLVGISAKVYSDASAAAGIVKLGDETAPGSDVDAYAEKYEIYRSMYSTLRETFHRLGE